MTTPRLSAAGAGGLLFDVSGPSFDEAAQRRLWAVAAKAKQRAAKDGVEEAIVGINNLLLMFDPLVLSPEAAADWLYNSWRTARATRLKGRTLSINVEFGGNGGPDLTPSAAGLGLGEKELVNHLCNVQFTVASLGAMPGFAYMTGLPDSLSIPRRRVPRDAVPAGSLILGPGMVAILPCPSPTGWKVVGTTDLSLFDPQRSEAAFFRLGDMVQFQVRSSQA